MTTEQKAKIMLAHAAGAEVEGALVATFENPSSGNWGLDRNPTWDWERIIYRLKPREPRRIWVNEYEDGSKFVHLNLDDAKAVNRAIVEQAKVTEFVEVIKP
jgi:hypothetical protein